VKNSMETAKIGAFFKKAYKGADLRDVKGFTAKDAK